MALQHNDANHRLEKAERGTSGAFSSPSAFALLCGHINVDA